MQDSAGKKKKQLIEKIGHFFTPQPDSATQNSRQVIRKIEVFAQNEKSCQKYRKQDKIVLHDYAKKGRPFIKMLTHGLIDATYITALKIRK